MTMLRRLVLPAPAFKFRIATLACSKCEAVASANDQNRRESVASMKEWRLGYGIKIGKTRDLSV